MKIKLFGKDIFEFNSNKGGALFGHSNNVLKKSKFLPDFNILSGSSPAVISEFMEYTAVTSVNGSVGKDKKKFKSNPKTKKEKKHLTPRGVYDMKMLNEKSFKLNANEKYVNEQLQSFKDKLSFIQISETDMQRGVQEISSIIIRLENRKKYNKFKEFFEKYPYTMISKVNELVEKHNYLKIGKVEQFMADMPKEAVKEMKDYSKKTKELCNKKPLFYIIADKKDFKKTQKRKDPILLAQSPFGHVWQILGVWDKEMLLLEEL